MFAIVEVSRSQLKVEKDSLVKSIPIKGNVGDSVEYTTVLMCSKNEDDVRVGHPYVDSAKVTAEIVAHDRGKKHFARIYKKRKQYKKSWGYRTPFTILKITDITC